MGHLLVQSYGTIKLIYLNGKTVYGLTTSRQIEMWKTLTQLLILSKRSGAKNHIWLYDIEEKLTDVENKD